MRLPEIDRRRDINMSDKEKQILETFEKVLPELSEMEREKLLSFGEGMAFMKDRQKETTEKES